MLTSKSDEVVLHLFNNMTDNQKFDDQSENGRLAGAVHSVVTRSNCSVRGLDSILSDHQDLAYEGIHVGYNPGHLSSYKIYAPKLNVLITTVDVTFQEYNENIKPYEQIIDMASY